MRRYEHFHFCMPGEPAHCNVDLLEPDGEQVHGEIEEKKWEGNLETKEKCMQVHREVPRHGHWSQSDRHACCSHLVSFLQVDWERNSSTFNALQLSWDQPVPSEHLLHQVDRDLDDLHHDLSLRWDLDGLHQGCIQDQDPGGERYKESDIAESSNININALFAMEKLSEKNVKNTKTCGKLPQISTKQRWISVKRHKISAETLEIGNGSKRSAHI